MEDRGGQSGASAKREEGFEFLGSHGGFGAELLNRDSAIDSEGRSRSSISSSETSRCSSSPTALGWPIRKADCSMRGGVREDREEPRMDDMKRMGLKFSEIEMAKERFSKLLLGEDMSGSGKGVCSALAISNAITNLSASVFGQLWRLEPLPAEKKSLWRREMEWLLCVTDHIVELIPSWQTFPDGSKVEVMTCRPRSDLFINIPALCKLDNMLLEILDGFENAEFWYIDQGIIATDGDGSEPFCKPIQRQEEKWWLPVPRVPIGGLHENCRKQLRHKRECTHQILKAAMTINNMAVTDIEVPKSYLENLPKNGRACLGDVIYRYITSDDFSSECLLDCLDLSSERIASEIVNRVEASIYMWRRRNRSRSIANPNHSTTKSSWEMVKELMVIDVDKSELLAERAEGLLRCLKLRFPGLTQTDLDASKIQHNKDVGKSILESYSRVLESLAFNIVARIDDLLYVDDLTKRSKKPLPVPSMIGIVTPRKKSTTPSSVPLSSTRKRAMTTPGRSPAPMGERTPFLSSNRAHRLGFGAKKALASYLGGNQAEDMASAPNTEGQGPVSRRESSRRTSMKSSSAS